MYLYDIIKIQFPKNRASSINMFLVVLVPFFLTVLTSAVLWSYQIFTAPVTSSSDMIVHYDVDKNRTAPISPPTPTDAPSLSRDVYLVSSYHFMCARNTPFLFLPPPHPAPAHWQQSCPRAASSALCLCGSGSGSATSTWAAVLGSPGKSCCIFPSEFLF